MTTTDDELHRYRSVLMHRIGRSRPVRSGEYSIELTDADFLAVVEELQRAREERP